MYDETLADLKVPIDLKALNEEIKLLAKALKLHEAEAVTAMGYVTRLLGRVVTAKEAYQFITELIKTKTPETLDNDERMLCVTIGALKRKIPFIALASKVGRNELCPCGSGKKYKTCCLELAKAADYHNFYGGSK